MNHMIEVTDDVDFLFGKIKYWRKPIFDLQKIESFPRIREYLSEKLNINPPKPYIQKPKKGTVLGHIKETIRFNNVKVESDNPKILQLVDDIALGFGEKGFYYDVNLRLKAIPLREIKQEFTPIFKWFQNFEIKIKQELEHFYISGYPEDDRYYQEENEISNFQISVLLDEKMNEHLVFLNSINSIISEHSNKILDQGRNFALPRLKFDILNENIFNSVETYRRKAKPLFNKRFFSFEKILSKENRWLIRSRGIPLKGVISIIERLLETPQVH
jgi:hypothetical protein